MISIIGWKFRGRSLEILGWPDISVSSFEVGRFTSLRSSRSRRLRVTGTGRVVVGDRCLLNVGATLVSVEQIEIGDDVAIADDAYITDSNFHGLEGAAARTSPVRIKSGAWIGARSIILPGVSVGCRAVVGAGSVVTKDVDDDTLVAGNPAKLIRRLVYPDGVTNAWNIKA